MANLTLQILKVDATVRWTPARWRTVDMELVGWGLICSQVHQTHRKGTHKDLVVSQIW